MEEVTSDQIDYESYARNMRLAMTNRDITTPNGEINHEYFLHKKGHFWGEDEGKRLNKVLEQLQPPFNVQEIKTAAKLTNKVKKEIIKMDIEVELRIQHATGNNSDDMFLKIGNKLK